MGAVYRVFGTAAQLVVVPERGGGRICLKR